MRGKEEKIEDLLKMIELMKGRQNEFKVQIKEKKKELYGKTRDHKLITDKLNNEMLKQTKYHTL